jgi:hypothetical protein
MHRIFSLVLLLVAFGAVGIMGAAEERRVGDIVLDGEDRFELTDETYHLRGNLFASGSARVIFRNAILVLEQDYLDQFYLRFSGGSRLEMYDSVIISQYERQLGFSDNASARLVRSRLGAESLDPSDEGHSAIISFSGASVCDIVDSDLQVAPQGFHIHGDATVSSVNSKHSVNLHFAGDSVASLTDLKPGAYISWDLQQDNEIFGSTMNVELQDCEVHSWCVTAAESAVVYVCDSDLVWVNTWEEGRLELKGCRIRHAVELDTETRDYCVQSLGSGFVEDWDGPGDAAHAVSGSLSLRDTVVAGWSLGADPFGMTVQEASEICVGSYVTTAVDAVIPQLHLTVGSGALQCTNIRVGYVHAPFGCWAEIKGSVEFEEEELQTFNHPWMNSWILRYYSVEVRDWGGAPVDGSALELRDAAGDTVWQGKTNLKGTAYFTLLFDDANHGQQWTLRALGLDADLPVVLLTDTPIRIVESPT